MLRAGYKHNVIPGEASAFIDGRFLPGFEDEFFETIDGLLGPDVTREFEVNDVALETDFDGALVDAMCASLQLEDPQRKAVPYCLSVAPTRKRCPHWGFAASGSRRCCSHPTWTLPGCSTASTSGCPSTPSSSAPGCWTIS